MNEAGELVEWDDAKGYGFVRDARGQRLFVHATAFERTLRRPEIGDRLAFSSGPGRDGRPAVIAARIAGLMPIRRGPSTERIEMAQSARLRRIAAAALLLSAAIYAAETASIPWLLGVYVPMGFISGAAYWNDKRAANAGQWRVSESTLHMLDLACGIIGGLLTQAALHHKTAKKGFSAVTWAIVAMHLVALVVIATGLLR